MICLYFIICGLAVVGLKLSPSNKDNLSVSLSTMIKGVFVLLVFVSHSSGYVEDQLLQTWNHTSSVATMSFIYVRHWLGQMIVVPFLFYSGFGIRLSISQKGDSYLDAMPYGRILKTYLHTVLIVFFFLVFQLCLGERYSFSQVLQSLLLWDSVGNSNWYMFAILLLYIFTFISFRLCANERKAVLLTLVLVLSYIVVLSFLKESWWYNTVIVYWFGLIYPDIRKKYEGLVGKDYKTWVIACVVIFVFFVILTLWNEGDGFIDALSENVRAVILMLWINTFLLNISLGNFILQWVGNHVFEIYLLQRIPMILFTKIGLARISICVWYLACVIMTVALTIIFEKLFHAFDQKLLFS